MHRSLVANRLCAQASAAWAASIAFGDFRFPFMRQLSPKRKKLYIMLT